MYELPDPVYVTLPGVLVMVQVPDDGSPLKTTLPAGSLHLGWVMAPTTGAVGFVITVNANVFKQPSEVLVYVNVVDPALTPVTSPALVMVATDELLLVQLPPADGVTLAEAPTQTEFAPPNVGLPGIGLMVACTELVEVQLLEFFTLNVYVVFTGNPVTVYEVPDPTYVIAPGFLVMVQVPIEGNPLRITLPVGTVQVGWVMVPS